MSSTWTSTHPLNSYQPSYISVEEFKETLQDALRNYYGDGLRAHHYRSVRLLLVFWEIDKDQRIKIGNFVDRLEDVFTRSYNYKVNKLGLQIQDPSSPQVSLMEALHAQMHNIDNDDLAIVYYVDHGKMEGNDLQTYATEYPKVNFSAVRRLIIDNAATNVLVLLDCCYAGGGAIGVNKEIIAASAGDQVVYNGTASFSSNLIQQLQHAAATKQISTSPQLYARLATKALVRNADGTAELGSTPVHIQKYQIYRCPIYLAPVTSVEDWSAPEKSFIFSQPVNVLLSVHLRDGQIKTLQELREWLSCSRPSGVLRVHFCDIFLSGSATLIFEVTLDVWDSLPDHPAISFISFKQNRHLPLPTSPQQTKPKSLEKEPDPFAKYRGDDSSFAKLLKENKKPGH
jgi:hypothetical protein